MALVTEPTYSGNLWSDMNDDDTLRTVTHMQNDHLYGLGYSPMTDLWTVCVVVLGRLADGKVNPPIVHFDSYDEAYRTWAALGR